MLKLEDFEIRHLKEEFRSCSRKNTRENNCLAAGDFWRTMGRLLAFYEKYSPIIEKLKKENRL